MRFFWRARPRVGSGAQWRQVYGGVKGWKPAPDYVQCDVFGHMMDRRVCIRAPEQLDDRYEPCRSCVVPGMFRFRMKFLLDTALNLETIVKEARSRREQATKRARDQGDDRRQAAGDGALPHGGRPSEARDGRGRGSCAREERRRRSAEGEREGPNTAPTVPTGRLTWKIRSK